MNIKLALTLLFLSTLAPGWAEAAISDTQPSAQIKPVLEPCLDAILSPLGADPRMPRVKIETLRAQFAAELVTASTPAEKNIYRNAMAVCDAMTSGMDARANARAGAEASAKEPTLSTGGNIIASTNARGWDAGFADEEIRKKEKDERAYEDKRAKKESAFVDSDAYTSWVKNAPGLRQNVMNLFTKQVELEALYAKNNTPTPAPPVAATQTIGNTIGARSSPGNPGPGTFTDSNGHIIKINPDHTAVHIFPHGAKIAGTWTFNEQGHSQIRFKHKVITADFSQDGKTFTTASGDVFTRAE